MTIYESIPRFNAIKFPHSHALIDDAPASPERRKLDAGASRMGFHASAWKPEIIPLCTGKKIF
ncbi:MAG: hypothetical protein KAI83_10915 [Thiomargarita sp.]|nr:hypothetical protein [Thiomargarita sp.]